jgi:hypothetical protein
VRNGKRYYLIIIIIAMVGLVVITNIKPLERLEISDSLSYFVPESIVLAMPCKRIQKHILKTLVASTPTDKAIFVIRI